jgi:hypothetical protein
VNPACAINPVVVLRTLFDSAWNTSKGMDTYYSLILTHANYASAVRYLAEHLLTQLRPERSQRVKPSCAAGRKIADCQSSRGHEECRDSVDAGISRPHFEQHGNGLSAKEL